jgi:hypothetical protein
MKMPLHINGSYKFGALEAVLILAFLAAGLFWSIDAKNDKDTFEQLKILAKRGSHQAQYKLATLYAAGEGVSLDYAEAMKWFRAAAIQNDRDAAYAVGVMYAGGLGTPKDEARAADWYRTAAEFGQSGAQFLTALNYATSKGGARDEAVAARWFYRAAEQGNTEAGIALAAMYGSGSGVQKDNVAAYAWATIAAATAQQKENRDRAIQLQTLTRRTMRPEEVVEAQEIALAWRPRLESRPPPPPALTNEQGGIQASLTLERSEAVARWRILRPLATEISELSVEVDQKPSGALTAEPYPRPDAKTSILILLDGSDPSHEAQILSDKNVALQMAQQVQSNEEFDVAIYANEFRLLLPADSGVGAIENQLRAWVPRPESANLGRALRTAIEMPSLMPTERRGVFVLTDGHSDDVVDTKALIENAKKHRTSLNFIVSASKRPILPDLAELAVATGGLVVTESGLAAFVQAPFWLLNSGGTARVALNLSPRPFWQSDPEVRFVLHAGTNELSLKTPVPVPVAGIRETTVLLTRDRPLVAAGSGAAVLALVGGLAFHIGRRRRKKAIGSEVVIEDTLPHQILALLKNKADGVTYPIQSRIVQLGRGGEAHIRLKDETVSRIHAILRQLKSGAFEIENRSGNGTFVNNQKVEIATLADGDLVTMGLTTLHYSRSEPLDEAMDVAAAPNTKETALPH